MKQAIKIVFQIIVVLMIVDFIGMILWAMSGQFPVDNFYIGSITMHIIKLFV